MTTRVLCVCVGNIFRSVMLERFLRRGIAERNIDADVESVGVDPAPGTNVRPRTLETMLRKGLDLSDHKPRPLSTVDLSQFDLVIAMTPQIMAELSKKNLPGRLILANAEQGGIPDTKIGSPEEYEQIASLTEKEAEKIVATL